MLNALMNEATARYATVQRGASTTAVLQIADFCEAVRASSVPLCQAEAYMLAQLLNRDKGTGSGSSRSTSIENVDLSLLRRISNGEILQAALS
jgi:hypothetical protein